MKLRTQRHRTLAQQRHAPATLTLRRRGGTVVLIHRRGQLRSTPVRLHPVLAAIERLSKYEEALLVDLDSPGGDVEALLRARTAIIPR